MYVCVGGSKVMDKVVPPKIPCLEITKFSANKNVVDVYKVLNALFHAALLPSESKCTTPTLFSISADKYLLNALVVMVVICYVETVLDPSQYRPHVSSGAQ